MTIPSWDIYNTTHMSNQREHYKSREERCQETKGKNECCKTVSSRQGRGAALINSQQNGYLDKTTPVDRPEWIWKKLK